MSGVTLTGDWRRFESQLHKLVNFNFTRLHKNIGEELVSSTKKRFKTQTGPDGTKWPKSVRAEESGGQTLTDTARLKNSVTYQAKVDGVAAGTNVKYASTHQPKDGKPVKIKAKRANALKFQIGGKWITTKKTVTIPPRPFLGINEKDVKEIKAITDEQIEETLR